MRLVRFNIFIALALTFVSCEDLIELDLNKANPKIVIDADLNDLSAEQVIRVSRTVDFDSPIASEPITGAIIQVRDNKGMELIFEDQGNGSYRHRNFKPKAGTTYTLTVNVDGEIFTSSTVMSPFVPVDSLAVKEETRFDEVYYSVVLKFYDPLNTPNYYKYSMSVNGKPFEFVAARSDKFNDGLYVGHDLTDRDNELALGDSVIVRRHCVAKEVYSYWSEIQMLNPGSAAPANPTSNISNGALGYFSVSSAKEYGFKIIDVGD